MCQTARTIDAFGNVTEYTYDARGLLVQTRSETEQTDPITGITTTAWLITRTVYDANGRAVYATDSYVEGDAGEPSEGERWGTHTVYDALGRVIRTERLKGLVIDLAMNANGTGETTLADAGVIVSHSGSTTFDAAGRVSESVDEFGTITRYSYDALGRTLETRRQSRNEAGDPVWLVSRTAYDSLGRAFASSDTFVLPFDAAADAQADYAVPGSIQLYDDAGRMIGSQQVLGIQIDIATGAAVLLTPGEVLSTTQTIYDAQGRVARTIDLRGNATDYEYDAFGRQVAVIGPVQTIHGELQRHRTETEYDAMGRQHLVRDNIAVVVDAAGTVIETRRDEARETTFIYDSQSRMVQTIFADGTSTQTEYDEFGRAIAETDQIGQTTRHIFDDQGRLAAVTLPEVADPANAGQLVSPVYRYTYDAEGNHTGTTDPLGRLTTFTYNERGQQLTRTLPLGNVPLAERIDAAGLPLSQAASDWTERSEYDDRGRLTLHISFEGRVMRYIYDDTSGSSGRLSAKHFWASEADYAVAPNEPAERLDYRYDAFGREAVVTHYRGTEALRETTKRYDAFGRMIEIASQEGTIHYAFNNATGDLLRTWTGDIDDAFTDTRYTYDALGRLATAGLYERFDIPLASPELAAYTYDLLGQIDRLDHFNGVIVDYIYDDLGRIVEFTNYAPDGVTGDPDTLADNAIDSRFVYDLRDDGMRIGATEQWQDTFDEDGDGDTTELFTATLTWTYDSLNRLTSETYIGDPSAAGSYASYADTYVLDLVGNRLAKQSDTGADGIVDTIVAYTYDQNDRILTETKDVQSGTDGDDSFTAYTWNHTEETGSTVYAGLDAGGAILETTTRSYDLQGRMAETVTTKDGHSTRTTMEYDFGRGNVHGLRVVETSYVDGVETKSTTYLYDPQNLTGYEQVIDEVTVTLGEPGDDVTITTYAIAHDVLAQARLAGATEQVMALLTDAGGSTRQLADALGELLTAAEAAGEPVVLFAYDAFGVPRLDTATALTSMLYRGEYQSTATQLQYLRARWYTPTVGAFSRLDVIAGSLQAPVTLGRYLYADSNPVTYIDPSGEFALVEIAVAGAILSFLAASFLPIFTPENAVPARVNLWVTEIPTTDTTRRGAQARIYDEISTTWALVEASFTAVNPQIRWMFLRKAAVVGPAGFHDTGIWNIEIILDPEMRSIGDSGRDAVIRLGSTAIFDTARRKTSGLSQFDDALPKFVRNIMRHELFHQISNARSWLGMGWLDHESRGIMAGPMPGNYEWDSLTAASDRWSSSSLEKLNTWLGG